MNSRVKAAVDAINALDNYDELRPIYQAIRAKETRLSRDNIRSVVKGCDVEFKSRNGNMIRGVVTKVNRKTVEVVQAGATPFGRTTYKVPASMLTVV